MNRRDFVRSSSLVTIPLLLKSCHWPPDKDTSYPITVHSDAGAGHLIFESKSFPETESISVETLIVGGGMAGMAAACTLKGKDFLLCELSDELGGTSSAYRSDHLTFAQGAHYDMAYPGYYGNEVLELLEELGIIHFQSWKNSWGFVDEQHLIMHRRKNQCFDQDEFRKEVIKVGPLRNEFFKLLEPYQGQMPLPTRLIDKQFHALNEITFMDFLQSRLKLTEDFTRSVSYHMKDDYGGDVNQVSALAGIHYFTCRPYNAEIVELFSPPEGNHYFIQKMIDHVGSEQLKTSHLVKSIITNTTGFNVKIVDVNQRVIKNVNARNIIYAGQKHALKYVFPSDYSLFQDIEYAPWMVVNVVLDHPADSLGYWQNEVFTKDETFLGFVDSSTQYTVSGKQRVLTAYYCLPLTSRNDLVNAETNKTAIANTTVTHLSRYFDRDISANVTRVDIKVMGHAMPIPGKNYLLYDRNLNRKNKNLIYAGVDNGKLPLLFEAIDTGIIAAKMTSDKRPV